MILHMETVFSIRETGRLKPSFAALLLWAEDFCTACRYTAQVRSDDGKHVTPAEKKEHFISYFFAYIARKRKTCFTGMGNIGSGTLTLNKQFSGFVLVGKRSALQTTRRRKG